MVEQLKRARDFERRQTPQDRGTSAGAVDSFVTITGMCHAFETADVPIEDDGTGFAEVYKIDGITELIRVGDEWRSDDQTLTCTDAGNAIIEPEES